MKSVFILSFGVIVILAGACQNNKRDKLIVNQDMHDDEIEDDQVDSLNLYIAPYHAILDSAMHAMDRQEIDECYNFLMWAKNLVFQEFTIGTSEDTVRMEKAIAELQLIAERVKKNEITTSDELDAEFLTIKFSFD